MEQKANSPSLDRVLVLAATVGALARFTCWLETQCGCGSSAQIPVPLLAKQGQAARSVADVLLRQAASLGRAGRVDRQAGAVRWRAPALARRVAALPVTRLTAARARALHAATVERGAPAPLWFVYAVPAHPGRVEARAYVETHAGGELLGTLSAGSLDELHAMLPAGLIRHERTPIDPPEVLEMWD